MKNYIDFKPSKCKDCCRCLKSCPVKAIGIIDHQAKIIPERCIQCGKCTRVCPQHAKAPFSQLDELKALLASGRGVVASVAPSFVSSFKLKSFEQMRTVLTQLGFDYAEETSVAAAAVTAEYARLLKSGEYKKLISSACSSTTRLIQTYYPGALKYLAPVDSPMTVHSRMLKKRFPGSAIVFIGPCISKKREADAVRIVENVLTFNDLAKLMRERGLSFPADTPRPGSAPGASARCYPINGGIIKSFIELPEGYEYISVDSDEKCAEVLKNIDSLKNMFVEMNSCEFGCINGPCSMVDTSTAETKAALLRLRDIMRDGEHGQSEDGD